MHNRLDTIYDSYLQSAAYLSETVVRIHQCLNLIFIHRSVATYLSDRADK